MNHDQEITAEDIHKSMMQLEKLISNDKRMIRENNTDDKAILSFTKHTFSLTIKRLKHSLYIYGKIAQGDKFEKLVKQNEKPISLQISADAFTVMANVNIYDISLEDTFIKLLKGNVEYLKPILITAME